MSKITTEKLDLARVFTSELRAPVKDYVYVLPRWTKLPSQSFMEVEDLRCLDSDRKVREDLVYMVEEAPCAIRPAKCKNCEEEIHVGELRFGYFHCVSVPAWFHIACTPLDFLGFDSMASIMLKCAIGDKLTEDSQFIVAPMLEKGLKFA